jgi:hypothetical protein
MTALKALIIQNGLKKKTKFQSGFKKFSLDDEERCFNQLLIPDTQDSPK